MIVSLLFTIIFQASTPETEQPEPWSEVWNKALLSLPFDQGLKRSEPLNWRKIIETQQTHIYVNLEELEDVWQQTENYFDFLETINEDHNFLLLIISHEWSRGKAPYRWIKRNEGFQMGCLNSASDPIKDILPLLALHIRRDSVAADVSEDLIQQKEEELERYDTAYAIEPRYNYKIDAAEVEEYKRWRLVFFHDLVRQLNEGTPFRDVEIRKPADFDDEDIKKLSCLLGTPGF